MTEAAVTTLNPEGSSPFVLLCEHASNHIPEPYKGLGLGTADLARHIAWDIGAAALARQLSARLDAPLFLSGYSRLLIDCNRPLGSPTSIPVLSEATEIPGNRDLPAAEVAARQDRYFRPFHAAVAACLDARRGRPTIVIGVHSFTPVYLGIARPWQAGLLYADAVALGRGMIEALAGPGLTIGDNEPYRIEPEHDYTVPVHGDARGLPAALIEVRQDLLADETGIEAWAVRLVRAFRAVQAGH
ncbi:N-formylglutamate amidohydrolase [Belnapia rosea]|uniref:N-formylglutamate amidohydrolase n=1 Tax=Belnapia rosea TaxID=938405 RepID=UPI000883FD02|nr:N-formylglutamate amidohydrolase [Belnapia rosea]SDB69314.1 Predicted N-formylglutamate amidohydrolase [Belnapia rosea]